MPSPHTRLVIGIGNPLRGDDGVGPLLAEQVAVPRAPRGRKGAAVRSMQQLTPELAEEVAQLEAVLFIDAWLAPAGGVPQLKQLSPIGPGGDSHRLEPAALLAMALALYGRAPRAHLLLVPAFALGHGTTFSPGLRALLPQAQALMQQWLAGHA